LNRPSVAILVDGQAVVDILNEAAEMQQTVAGLLPKRMRKSTEISGKRGTQTIETNEINALVKTLNQ
jgi:hypothetical protein